MHSKHHAATSATSLDAIFKGISGAFFMGVLGAIFMEILGAIFKGI